MNFVFNFYIMCVCVCVRVQPLRRWPLSIHMCVSAVYFFVFQPKRNNSMAYATKLVNWLDFSFSHTVTDASEFKFFLFRWISPPSSLCRCSSCYYWHARHRPPPLHGAVTASVFWWLKSHSYDLSVKAVGLFSNIIDKGWDGVTLKGAERSRHLGCKSRQSRRESLWWNSTHFCISWHFRVNITIRCLIVSSFCTEQQTW